ncbi:hypothetical protein EDC04DRAFT_2896143 [Pisolithus marmoratus]|nr:hypothetical protein EDC04DRAFT_2896143 [Pisolithus marmoratus]
MSGLHPGFSIPTVPDGGNHTSTPTEAVSTIEAHETCLDVLKALAAVGIRVLQMQMFLSNEIATDRFKLLARFWVVLRLDISFTFPFTFPLGSSDFGAALLRHSWSNASY